MIDIPLRGGDLRSHAQRVLCTVDTGHWVVEPEAVVGPAGLGVLVLSGEQQWGGSSSPPGTPAIQGLRGPAGDLAGVGVEQFAGSAGHVGDHREERGVHRGLRGSGSRLRTEVDLSQGLSGTGISHPDPARLGLERIIDRELTGAVTIPHLRGCRAHSSGHGSVIKVLIGSLAPLQSHSATRDTRIQDFHYEVIVGGPHDQPNRSRSGTPTMKPYQAAWP